MEYRLDLYVTTDKTNYHADVGVAIDNLFSRDKNKATDTITCQNKTYIDKNTDIVEFVFSEIKTMITGEIGKTTEIMIERKNESSNDKLKYWLNIIIKYDSNSIKDKVVIDDLSYTLAHIINDFDKNSEVKVVKKLFMPEVKMSSFDIETKEKVFGLTILDEREGV